MDDFARRGDDDRLAFINEAAARRDVTPIIIEKDFWVCWTLRRLMSVPVLADNLTFKGGTSLSKAYGIIDRFSEDIDLTIGRNAPMIVDTLPPMEDGISGKERERRTKALKAAASLVGHGADQQKIVRALYRTEPLPLLKLWGRALSHVRWDEKYKLILAPVSLEDLVQSRAHTHDLSLVLEKIRGSFSLATTFVLFFQESPVSVRMLLKCHNTEMINKLHDSLPESEIQGEILAFSLAATSLETAETSLRSRLIPFLDQAEA